MTTLRPAFPGRFPRLALCLTLFAGVVHAQVLLDQTSEIGAASVAPPVEFAFTEAGTQALTVTLTDDQLPAPLPSLQLAVTLDDAVVGTASLAQGATSATVNIPAAAGSYGLHVIGTPTGSLGLGSFSVCVTPQGSPPTCSAAGSHAFSGNIQAPAAVTTNGISTLNTPFVSTIAGIYTVTLTDDAFPAALSQVLLNIAQGSTGVPGGTGITQFGTIQVTLAASTTYTLLIGAAAASPSLAGLYGIQVTDPSGNVVFGRTLPVGTMGPSTIVANPTAQALQLTVNDLAFPAALSSVGAAVTAGAFSYTTLTAAGQGPSFNAASGTLELWQYAAAAAQTTGVYSLTLATASSTPTTLYSTTQVVEAANPAAVTSFAYVVDIPAAGPYTVAVTDFQIPALQSLGSPVVAQNGTPLTVSSGGSFTAAAAGPVVVLVNAQPEAGMSGIFSVTVGAGGSAPLLLDRVQTVGGVFNSQQINFGSTGTYAVTVADLAFPAKFQNLAAVLSSNGQVLGKTFGGGSFQINASPGQYQLTFLATPGSENYGLYSIHIAAAAPSVTFTASASSVNAGQPVQLTWSSSDATSCTAGGATGWSGSEATSGTLGLTIDATVTLTLACSGPGGASAPRSVTITAVGTLPASGGGGGGGGLDLAAVLGLLGLLGVRQSKKHG